jgi:hypothetical protein
MARVKNPEAHFRRARERGAQENTGIVNDEPVLKRLEDGTKKNYEKQLSLWYQFMEDNNQVPISLDGSLLKVISLPWSCQV